MTEVRCICRKWIVFFVRFIDVPVVAGPVVIVLSVLVVVAGTVEVVKELDVVEAVLDVVEAVLDVKMLVDDDEAVDAVLEVEELVDDVEAVEAVLEVEELAEEIAIVDTASDVEEPIEGGLVESEVVVYDAEVPELLWDVVYVIVVPDVVPIVDVLVVMVLIEEGLDDDVVITVVPWTTVVVVVEVVEAVLVEVIPWVVLPILVVVWPWELAEVVPPPPFMDEDAVEDVENTTWLVVCDVPAVLVATKGVVVDDIVTELVVELVVIGVTVDVVLKLVPLFELVEAGGTEEVVVVEADEVVISVEIVVTRPVVIVTGLIVVVGSDVLIVVDAGATLLDVVANGDEEVVEDGEGAVEELGVVTAEDVPELEVVVANELLDVEEDDDCDMLCVVVATELVLAPVGETEVVDDEDDVPPGELLLEGRDIMLVEGTDVEEEREEDTVPAEVLEAELTIL